MLNSDGGALYTAVPLLCTLTEGSEGRVGGKESILGGAEIGVMGREAGDALLVLKVSNTRGFEEERLSVGLRSFECLL